MQRKSDSNIVIYNKQYVIFFLLLIHIISVEHICLLSYNKFSMILGKYSYSNK